MVIDHVCKESQCSLSIYMSIVSFCNLSLLLNRVNYESQGYESLDTREP